MPRYICAVAMLASFIFGAGGCNRSEPERKHDPAGDGVQKNTDEARKPKRIAAFDLTEAEAKDSGKEVRYGFKSRSADAEAEVIVKLDDCYEFTTARKKSDTASPRFGAIKVMRGELVVASASAGSLRGKWKEPVGVTDPQPEAFSLKEEFTYEPGQQISLKFVPSDTGEYRIVIDAIQGFRKYRIDVAQ